MTDYYKILGVEIAATREEIRLAYRKLSKKFHPDKNDGDIFFENMFKQVQEAYEILGNSEKRKTYDNQFHKNDTINSNLNFEPVIDFFESSKRVFYSGEEITFKWLTYNADLIEIKPFGVVDQSGEKSYKLNNINKEFLKIELIASNTKISKVVEKQIILENKIFKDAKSQSAKYRSTSNSDDNLYHEKFWSYKGRLRRSDFIIRSILIGIPFAIAMSVIDNPYNPPLIMLICGILSLVLIITHLLQVIKRLHDINYNGWWYFISLIPLLNIIFYLIIIFGDGTVGKNRFGLDPKNR